MNKANRANGFLETASGIKIAMRQAGPPSDEPVVLCAGWPQTLHAWRHVQDHLATAGVRSIAMDPPGFGESDLLGDAPDYTTPKVAVVMADALASAGITRYALVGHDVGAWIAYAWAVGHPNRVSRLVLLDAAIPGAMPNGLFTLERAPGLFQFFFNAVPELPEQLTRGRERIYLDWFFQAKTRIKGAVTQSDVDVYMECFSQADRMSAGFNYYRAVPASASALEGAAPLSMPVLALGAQYGVGEGLVEAMRPHCTNLKGGVVADSGHFLPEEVPDALTGRILDFT